MVLLHKSGTPRLPEIEIGSEICKKLKKIYFDDLEWADACTKVSEKFTTLKNIYRGLFPKHSNMEMLEILQKYSLQDLEDVFSHPVPEKKKNTSKEREFSSKPIYQTVDPEPLDLEI